MEVIDNKVEELGDKMEDTGEKVQSVNEKVQMVIHGTLVLFNQSLNLLTSILSDGEQARIAAKETNLAIQQAANDIDEIKCLWLLDPTIFRGSRLIYS